MISSILMVIIISIIVLSTACYLFYLMVEAVKYEDVFWLIAILVVNIVYWLSVITLILEHFGL